MMKQYKRPLIFSLMSFALFIILRNIYPVPNFTADSRGYIYGAMYADSVISYRPLGYSAFLKVLHIFLPSISAVAYAQYFLFLASALFFLFTFFKVFDLKPLYRDIIFFLALIDLPLLLLANSMLSDSLFISLTLIWITLHLRVLLYHRWIDIAFLLLALWCSFFVRYSAMIYPVFTIVAFLLFTPGKLKKISAISSAVLLSIIFHSHTTRLVENATGTPVFSGFSGWQLSNNAMSVYEDTPDARVDASEPDILLLDSLSRKYIDSVRKVDPGHHGIWVDEYMWASRGPFQVFKQKYLARKPSADEFAAWTAVSVTLNKYGWQMIKSHPLQYSRHFLLINVGFFLYPQLDGLSQYETPVIDQLPVIKTWYGIPAKVTSKFISLPGYLCEPFRDIYCLLSLVFPISVLLYLVKPGMFIVSPQQRKVILSIALFWLLAAGFNILVAPVHYRFIAMLFPVILCGTCALWGNHRSYFSGGTTCIKAGMLHAS